MMGNGKSYYLRGKKAIKNGGVHKGEGKKKGYMTHKKIMRNKRI